MKKVQLKSILLKFYSTDMVKSILIGRARPSYDNMLKLNKLYKIPFTAWADLNSYINTTTSKKIME